MHHIKLKVPSFAPFVTGIIDNIKMTVHKYHNVWISHRMNYEPRKLMDIKHSCGDIYDSELDAAVGFTPDHTGTAILRTYGLGNKYVSIQGYTLFSPVMSFRSWLRPYASVDKNYDPEYVLDFWFENKMVDFKCYFDAVLQHIIRSVKHYPDISYLPYVHKRSSYQYFSHVTITAHVTDDIKVTFKPCR